MQWNLHSFLFCLRKTPAGGLQLTPPKIVVMNAARKVSEPWKVPVWLSMWLLCALPWDQSCVWAANDTRPEFRCTGCICTLPSVRHEMGMLHISPHHLGRSRAPCTSHREPPWLICNVPACLWHLRSSDNLRASLATSLGEWKLTGGGSGRRLPPLSHLWLSSFSVSQLGYNTRDIAEAVK